MASVRMTKELREKIVREVRASYRTMLEAVKMPKEIEEKMISEFTSIVKGECAKAADVIAELVGVVRKALPENLAERGYMENEYAGKTMKRDLAAAVGQSVRYSQTLYLNWYDPEKGKEIEIFRCDWKRPQSWEEKGFRLLAWNAHEIMAERSNFTDPELLLKAMPVYRRRMELLRAQREMVQHAEQVVYGCNTVKQLLTVWPAAKELLPQHVLDKLEERPQPRGNSGTRFNPAEFTNPNMDEELKSVHAQAKAIDALNF